jgi:hypothetical protein
VSEKLRICSWVRRTRSLAAGSCASLSCRSCDLALYNRSRVIEGEGTRSLFLISHWIWLPPDRARQCDHAR